MSDLYQIESHLGELVTYDGGQPSVYIDGPSEVREGLLCTWTAVVSGGVSPFEYDWSGMFCGSGPSIGRVATTSGFLYVDIEDWMGRTTGTSIYITVSPDGPEPPGCSE